MFHNGMVMCTWKTSGMAPAPNEHTEQREQDDVEKSEYPHVFEEF